MKVHQRLLLFLLVSLLLAGCRSAAPANPTVVPGQATSIAAEQVIAQPAAEDQQASPTTAAAPESTTPPDSDTPGQDYAAGWAGLSFDAFLEASHDQLLRRNPELVTELGLDTAFGMPGDQLTDISLAYTAETYELVAAIYQALQHYDRAPLSPEQQLSYDIYAWYLDDLLRGQEFEYYRYPVTHFITGAQIQLIQFFTDIHPVTNREQAEDYLTRLGQVDEKFDQLIENMRQSEAQGVITPRFILEWSLGDIRAMGNRSPRATVFYTSFADKVAALDLSQAEQDDLLARAESEIGLSVTPAFRALASYLEDLIQRAPTEAGAWQHPNGAAYYQYQVRHFTTTEMSADEIHALGLQELARIHAELRALGVELGYPAELSIPDLIERVVQDSGYARGPEIVAGYEDLIAAAKQQVQPVFDLQPRAAVIVIGGPTGGYYVPPAIDGSRPGAFYASNQGQVARFGMATLAYHEAVPGHHFQIAIAQELELPSFRRGTIFTAYAEGWALYAEGLMAELGAYTDDPYGNIGRLQAEAFRAARLVVDTGIHVLGWDFDQAVAFMAANTGMPPRDVQFEVSRYIAWPGQALAYKIGMLTIMDLRQQAQQTLGAQFELTEFHNQVLSHGSVPLDILAELIEQYIASQAGS